MLENLTEHDIASAVILTRDRFKGSVLIAEGEHDCLLMDKFINTERCSTQPAYGKENALKALKILNDKGLKGILALVDADHCHIEGNTCDSEHVIVTEYHDMEILILQSNALNIVLKEYASTNKLEHYLKSCKESSIFNLLLKKASPFGALRYLSRRDKLNLCFSKMKHDKIVDKKNLDVHIPKLVQTIIVQSGSSQKEKSLIDNICKVLDAKHDHLQLCCGHDVTVLLAIALKSLIGSNNSSVANKENIEKILRLSFDSSDFKRTRVYNGLKQWEIRNSPYAVFPDIG